MVFDAVINSGVVRLMAAFGELELKIAGWAIVIAGKAAWESLTLAFNLASTALETLWSWYKYLFDAFVEVNKLTFGDTLTGAWIMSPVPV